MIQVASPRYHANRVRTPDCTHQHYTVHLETQPFIAPHFPFTPYPTPTNPHPKVGICNIYRMVRTWLQLCKATERRSITPNHAPSRPTLDEPAGHIRPPSRPRNKIPFRRHVNTCQLATISNKTLIQCQTPLPTIHYFATPYPSSIVVIIFYQTTRANSVARFLRRY